jgi:hypothetical protein
MEEEYQATVAYYAVEGKAPEPSEFFGVFAAFLSALETARIEARAMAVCRQPELRVGPFCIGVFTNHIALHPRAGA